MESFVRSPDPDYPLDIPLKNRHLAAFLAWIVPGAGHIYQGRTAKGILFMVCVLGTYFFGFALGEGRVVYASFRKNDMRFPYICQVGVGLPALPALVQRQRVVSGKPPLWRGVMAPPQVSFNESEPDELARWHRRLKGRFELATLYTMVAGLLNVLAIYDAYAGPVFMLHEQKSKDRGPPPNSGDGSGDPATAGKQEENRA